MSAATAAAAACLLLEDVTVAYDGRAALEGVTMSVPHGAQVAIVGPNGAGKSTLFKALVGLLPVRSGTHAPAATARRASTGTRSRTCPSARRSTGASRSRCTTSSMMGRYGRLGWFRRPGAADREVVARCLDELGIAELERRAIGELSGGQQQRVFLARALAQEPHVLLLDEPFTGVDVGAREALLTLLDKLRGRGITVLVSTHDMETAAQRFELTALLNRRLIAYGEPATVFTQEHLSEAFGGQALFLGGMVVIDQCCEGHLGDGEGHGHSHEPPVGP